MQTIMQVLYQGEIQIMILFHKVCRIFDLINKVFKEKDAAARDLTVDESMVGHKGRDYTVQYMPAKKAHRWCAKLWVLAESDTGYTLSTLICISRESDFV